MTSDSAVFFFFSFSLAYSQMQNSWAPRKAGESCRRHARSWKCGTFGNVNVLLSHSLKRGCYASLKRNSSGLARNSCSLIRRTGGTHLIVSGSISFKWLDDAWKMLLLLMFMLFSLLHKRIVDISAQSYTALRFSAVLHLSIQDCNPQSPLLGRSQRFAIYALEFPLISTR